MAIALPDISARLRLDTSALDQSVSRVRGSLGKLAAAAGGAFAAVQLGGFLKDSVGAAADLNETLSKSQAIFGDSAAAAIQAYAKDAPAALGQTRQAAIDAVSTFGSLFKVAGLSAGKSADYGQKLTSLATDLASFNNASPQEAVEALGAALRGEAEPIRRFNVLLDDATLRQAAVRKGLIKTTKQAMTPAVKAQAAYAVILEQTKDAQGDFAKTSDGLANRQRILSARFAELKTQLGSALLPIVNRVAGFLVDRLFPAIGKVTTALRDGFSGDTVARGGALLGFFRHVGDAIGGAYQALSVFFQALRGQSEVNEFDGALQAVNNFGIALRDNLLPKLAAVRDFIANEVLPRLKDLAGWIFDNVIPAVDRLGEAFTNHLLPWIKNTFIFIRDQFLKGLGDLRSSLGDTDVNIDRNSEKWQRLLDRMKEVDKFIRERVVPYYKFTLGGTFQIVGEYINIMKQQLEFWNGVLQTGIDLAEKYVDLLKKIKDLLPGIPGIDLKDLVPDSLGDVRHFLPGGNIGRLASLGPGSGSKLDLTDITIDRLGRTVASSIPTPVLDYRRLDARDGAEILAMV